MLIQQYKLLFVVQAPPVSVPNSFGPKYSAKDPQMPLA
jgi:hypothetical protein